jgi:aldose 1-epimerase
MTSAVTGQQYQIGAGSYHATITELGAGLRELLFHDQPVIAGYDADELPPGAAGQPLAPWPNRINGGRYDFGGARFQLALTEPEHANAIHGLTRWMAWTPVRHDASAVVLLIFDGVRGGLGRFSLHNHSRRSSKGPGG